MMFQRGFKQLSTDAQVVFKKVLQALSEPGLVIEYDYADIQWPTLYSTTTGLFLALCDVDTPFSGDLNLLTDNTIKSLAFHTQAPYSKQLSQASFVLFDEKVTLDILLTLAKGSALAPEKNCTVIIQCSDEAALQADNDFRLVLKGAGINQQRSLSVPFLNESSGIIQYLLDKKARFPMGLDFVLTTPNAFIGLSRTTQVEIQSCM